MYHYNTDAYFVNCVILLLVKHNRFSPYYYYQNNVNLYPYNEKNAILFIEIYKKDGVFNMNLSISDELKLVSKVLDDIYHLILWNDLIHLTIKGIRYTRTSSPMCLIKQKHSTYFINSTL